nr:MAG TPA: hypothetical protein [Microviridae sp.]
MTDSHYRRLYKYKIAENHIFNIFYLNIISK